MYANRKLLRTLAQTLGRPLPPIQGAAEVREASIVTGVTNVTLTLATEVVVVSCDPLVFPTDTAAVAVFAWAQVTTAVGTTTLTPGIRRGLLITDPLVGEANAEAIKAAAGSTEPVFILTSEFFSGRGVVQYSLTVISAGAASTAIQYGIAALLL